MKEASPPISNSDWSMALGAKFENVRTDTTFFASILRRSSDFRMILPVSSLLRIQEAFLGQFAVQR